jgi:hypothetical protein
MTIARVPAYSPRTRPPNPRAGIRRATGEPGEPTGNPVEDTGATAWFDSRDGSGLQQVPSRVGAGVVTLGSTTGVDTNDPTWSAGPPYGWTFDATDDYMDTSGAGMVPTFDFDTGAYTHLQVVTMSGLATRPIWSSGNSFTRYFRLNTSGTTGINMLIRGPSAPSGSSVHVVGPAGTRAVIGFVINAGTANTYVYVGSTGTLGTAYSLAGAGGTIVADLTAPRYANWSYFVTGSNPQVLSAAVEYNGTALSKTDMDTVAAYLLALY